MKTINSIYIARKNKVILNDTVHTKVSYNKEYVATIMKNINDLGYTFSKGLFNSLCKKDESYINDFYLEIVSVLKTNLGANVVYKPMYPNFPQQVMDSSYFELYFNAILHYWSDGVVLPEYEKKERLPFSDYLKYKVIDIGDKKEFEQIFTNLCSSKTSLSETDKEDIKFFIESYNKDILSLIPDNIPLKENVALIGSILQNNNLLNENYYKHFQTATDVLRFAVSLSNGDISLAENTKFISFKRSTRKMLLQLLDNCGNIEEDMLRYKGQWIKLGERLHPGEYPNFSFSAKAFHKIRNNIKIETFNGKVQKSININNIKQSLSLLKTRPGDFARKLDYLFRTFKDHKDIIKTFESVAKNVSIPVLLQVKEHFTHRNENNEIRVFFPKGNTSKLYGTPNKLKNITLDTCKKVASICENAIISNFKLKSKLGKVYIDPKLKNYIIPFSQRSASKALKTLVRGSKIDFPENITTIRSFVYWKQPQNTRVDIDLSAVIYDKNWNYLENCSYFNLKSASYKASHSGDITAAPNGASEFIDLDIESVLNMGGRYVTISVNSFTQQSYKDLPICFMGFMGRNKPSSGEIYEPKTVQNKIDLTADSKICVPMILDLQEKKVIWADISLRSVSLLANNISSNYNNMTVIGKAITNIVKPNLFDLFKMHVKARGTLSDSPKNADLIFSVEEGVTPFHTEEIMGKYL
jgi:hypothetical protein